MVFAIYEHSVIRLEATFDTFAAFAATDAVGRNTLELRPSLAQLEREEHDGSQSRRGTVADKYAGEWSLEAELKILATPGVSFPEMHPILHAGIGVGADTGASITYSHQTGVLRSLQLANLNAPDFAEVANGAWLRQLSIEGAGQALTMIKASGGFASYASIKGAPTVLGAHSSGDTTIQLTAGHAKKIISGLTGARVMCDFGATKNNGGAGYAITAVDYNTNIITISPGLAVADALAGAETVRAFALAPTFSAGAPVPNTASQLSVDGAVLDFIRFRYDIDTGIAASMLEGSRNRPSRLELADRRMVRGELSAYLLDDSAALQAGGLLHLPQAIAMRFGPDTAGARVKINIPAATLEARGFERRNKGVAIFTSPWRADRYSTSDDESTLVLD